MEETSPEWEYKNNDKLQNSQLITDQAISLIKVDLAWREPIGRSEGSLHKQIESQLCLQSMIKYSIIGQCQSYLTAIAEYIWSYLLLFIGDILYITGHLACSSWVCNAIYNIYGTFYDISAKNVYAVSVKVNNRSTTTETLAMSLIEIVGWFWRDSVNMRKEIYKKHEKHPSAMGRVDVVALIRQGPVLWSFVRRTIINISIIYPTWCIG